MRAVVQRVTRANVTVEGDIIGEIQKGLVVLLGVARDDSRADVDYLASKITALRIFDDEQGKMNLSLKDIGGGMLVVSQFTLHGDVRRGLRPAWIDAAPPEMAEPLYESFIGEARKLINKVAGGKIWWDNAGRASERRSGDHPSRQSQALLASVKSYLRRPSSFR